jgi:hypothetical protein
MGVVALATVASKSESVNVKTLSDAMCGISLNRFYDAERRSLVTP